jgi:hypothetical protein
MLRISMGRWNLASTCISAKDLNARFHAIVFIISKASASFPTGSYPEKGTCSIQPGMIDMVGLRG